MSKPRTLLWIVVGVATVGVLYAVAFVGPDPEPQQRSSGPSRGEVSAPADSPKSAPPSGPVVPPPAAAPSAGASAEPPVTVAPEPPPEPSPTEPPPAAETPPPRADILPPPRYEPSDTGQVAPRARDTGLTFSNKPAEAAKPDQP